MTDDQQPPDMNALLRDRGAERASIIRTRLFGPAAPAGDDPDDPEPDDTTAA